MQRVKYHYAVLLVRKLNQQGEYNMCNCDKVIYRLKMSRGLRKEIKKYDKIENKTCAEQWQLCNLKSTVTSVPFTATNAIYDLCRSCEYGKLFLEGEGVVFNDD